MIYIYGIIIGCYIAGIVFIFRSRIMNRNYYKSRIVWWNIFIIILLLFVALCLKIKYIMLDNTINKFVESLPWFKKYLCDTNGFSILGSILFSQKGCNTISLGYAYKFLLVMGILCIINIVLCKSQHKETKKTYSIKSRIIIISAIIVGIFAYEFFNDYNFVKNKYKYSLENYNFVHQNVIKYINNTYPNFKMVMENVDYNESFPFLLFISIFSGENTYHEASYNFVFSTPELNESKIIEISVDGEIIKDEFIDYIANANGIKDLKSYIGKIKAEELKNVIKNMDLKITFDQIEYFSVKNFTDIEPLLNNSILFDMNVVINDEIEEDKINDYINSFTCAFINYKDAQLAKNNFTLNILHQTYYVNIHDNAYTYEINDSDSQENAHLYSCE